MKKESRAGFHRIAVTNKSITYFAKLVKFSPKYNGLVVSEYSDNPAKKGNRTVGVFGGD